MHSISQLFTPIVTFNCGIAVNLLRVPPTDHPKLMKYIVVITIFFLLVTFSSFLHNSFLDEYIEKDLEAKTKAILNERGIDYSDVQVNGHHLDADIASRLSSSVLEDIDGIIGIYLPPESGSNYEQAVDPSMKVPINYSAMDFRVERRGGTIYVTGGLPDNEYQLNLLYLLNANAHDFLVVDETVIADQPDYQFWWDGLPDKILPDFLNGSDGQGHVHFMAYDFEASGTFNKKPEYESIKAQLSRLPLGVIKDTNIKFEEPAVVLNPISTTSVPTLLKSPKLFVIEDANNNIVLRGVVDSEQTKNELIVATKVAIPTGTSVNFTQRLRVLEGIAPFDSLSSIKSLLTFHIQNTYKAELAYTDEGIALKGILNNNNEKQALLSLGERATNQRLKLSTDLKVDSVLAPARREILPVEVDHKKVLASGLKPLSVYFEKGSADVDAEQEQKIKKIALLIQNSGDQELKLIVGAYTDLRVNTEINRKLSLLRANKVRDKLIDLGIADERLIVKHFGEDVSGLPQSELWKARRVTITIQK